MNSCSLHASFADPRRTLGAASDAESAFSLISGNLRAPHRRNIIHRPTTQSRIPPALTSEIFSLKSATPISSRSS